MIKFAWNSIILNFSKYFSGELEKYQVPWPEANQPFTACVEQSHKRRDDDRMAYNKHGFNYVKLFFPIDQTLFFISGKKLTLTDLMLGGNEAETFRLLCHSIEQPKSKTR